MIKQFILLHISLIKFLNKELRKKRTVKQLITLLKDIAKTYLKTLLQQYKNLFLQLDPEYIKQKKQYEKYQQYRKDINNAYKLLMWMIKQGESRADRKNIKRDFEKYGRISKELEKQILRDVYGVKE